MAWTLFTPMSPQGSGGLIRGYMTEMYIASTLRGNGHLGHVTANQTTPIPRTEHMEAEI